MKELVAQMKAQIQTSVSISESQLVCDNDVVLNNSDINRLFGWAVFKVTKKYKRFCNEGNMNKR